MIMGWKIKCCYHPSILHISDNPNPKQNPDLKANLVENDSCYLHLCRKGEQLQWRNYFEKYKQI